MEVAAVVVTIHGKQFPLDEGEKATLESFLSLRVEVAAITLRRKINDAGEDGKIAINYEPERNSLEAALEDASLDQQHFTGELPALLEAARIPISAPFD